MGEGGGGGEWCKSRQNERDARDGKIKEKRWTKREERGKGEPKWKKGGRKVEESTREDYVIMWKVSKSK